MAQKKKGQARADVVGELLALIEEKMLEDPKGLVADYIRLVQLERELTVEEEKDVRLRWVDPDGGSTSES